MSLSENVAKIFVEAIPNMIDKVGGADLATNQKADLIGDILAIFLAIAYFFFNREEPWPSLLLALCIVGGIFWSVKTSYIKCEQTKKK